MAVTLGLLLPFLVFGRIRHHDFVLIDDNIHLQENRLLNPPTLDSARVFWRAPFLGLYIPATYSLWALEARQAYSPDTKKLDPRVFHEVSLLLHGANGVLAFLLFRIFCPVGPALIAALFFSLHPVQTEAVAWASAQKDLLCGFFGLLALWLYLRGRMALGTMSYALALLSKPAAVGLAAMAWALETGWLKRPQRESLPRLLVWVALALPILYVTKSLQPDQDIGAIVPLWQRPFVALDTLAFYVAKTLVPIRLSPDYSRAPDILIRHWMIYVSWLIPVIFGFLLSRRYRGWGWITLLFVAGILPVLGFVPFYFQVFSTVADRYLYLSLLAPALVFAQLTHFRWGRVTVAVVLILFAGLSYRQAGKWRDSQTLFEHTLEVNPGSLLAHNNLGAILEGKGRYREAYQHYASSVKLAPESVPPLYNIARLQAMQGNFELAKPLFYEVLSRAPDTAEAHQSLGAILNREGKFQEAEKHLEAALQLRPDLAKARNLLEEAKAGMKKNPRG